MTPAQLSHVRLRLRPFARGAASASLLAGLALLGACASPSSRFYTLNASEAATAPRPVASPTLLIEVPPVDVPLQVARNQFVVQSDPLKVKVLEQERWASLPGDEIRRALSTSLMQQLNTIDVTGTPRPEGVPLYRVNLAVQRFESWPGSHALLDAVWSVRAVGSQRVLTCRSIENMPVKEGYEALAGGHRRAVQQLATEIAAGIQTLASAPPEAPAASGSGTGTQKKTTALAPRFACPASPAALPATPDGASGVNTLSGNR
ncbi:PqiC family protein [Paraburkholderia bonniea]|uniref:PqiC family protein n=1 Tax=Paraburkholderia bonniea TaxID=2152891 RepID=UPI00129096F0|nr:PqiC family protein [Paraburkholderia bonniea]WJF89812.1 PqiC family protein [Paraburkholderia bonniea]WJF93126.1 PqiC family protein [Paraburkholderia bonniea]